MKTRLAAITRRRAHLLDEIAPDRDRMSALMVELRTGLALGGLALLAARLLRRSRWLRVLAAGGTAFAAALPLIARAVASRRQDAATRAAMQPPRAA
jgi:hypothetical protein